MDQAAVQALIDAAVRAAQQQLQQQLTAAQNDLVNAQNQIALLNANAAAAQAGNAPPAPPAPTVVQFAYTPGTAGNVAALIDYTTTHGAKIQRAATEKLSVDHDLDKEHLYDFLEALRSRAIACNWYGTIFQVPQDGQQLNIITNYGVLKKDAVDTKVRTYMFHNTREAQDDHNLFTCLEASLTKEAKSTLSAESATYTFTASDVQGIAPGTNPSEQRRSGLMYLWTIINRTTAMTTATISVLLEQLNNLPSVMQEVNHDVTAFNSKVRKMLTSYYANKREAYNETALLHNLGKAYTLCKDEEFVQYMKRKWSDHEDGTKVLTSQELMEFALKKYQTSVEEHTWGVDSKQTKTIMTLASKVGNIQKWQRGGNRSNTTQDSDQPTLSPAEYRKKRYDEAPAWMKKVPTDPKYNKKTVKGVEYTFCKFHKMYGKHSEDACRLNPHNTRTVHHRNTQRNSNNNTSADRPTTPTTTNNTNTVKYNKPQTMMAEVHDDDDYSTSSDI
jgi:hypothetical protein